MKPQINVAIDGYSSCGKSTLAKELAKALGYIYIDSGAMYRAVTYYVLTHHIDLNNAVELQNALNNIRITFESNSNTRQTETFLNGINVEAQIRDKAVSNLVSQVSAIKAVREMLVKQQQAMGNAKGVVMDGRDIGTVVFPDAEVKLFVTAHIAVRTQRRYAELIAKGIQTTPDEVQQNLQMRDHIDSTRSITPLQQAADAIVIDTTHLTREEQLKQAMEVVQQKLTLHH
ncbi:MAG TPA: (d)CMP kinase [Chitinophagales bacterium]|nr:(d)CMP kinase [Chitinophagales bacterium]HRK27853.1 (d)CMP kinase [Chitinophagales bacterium]